MRDIVGVDNIHHCQVRVPLSGLRDASREKSMLQRIPEAFRPHQLVYDFVFHGHDLSVSCQLSRDRGLGFPASIHFFEIINPTFLA